MAGIATGQFALGGLAALGALVILHIPPTATPIPSKRPPNTPPTRGAHTALTARGSASPQAISYWGDAGCQL
jgi:hypothetical protein